MKHAIVSSILILITSSFALAAQPSPACLAALKNNSALINKSVASGIQVITDAQNEGDYSGTYGETYIAVADQLTSALSRIAAGGSLSEKESLISSALCEEKTLDENSINDAIDRIARATPQSLSK